MSRKLSLNGYVEVLRLPGVTRPAIGVAVASLPLGALSLAMLLLVEASTERYATAGLVVGALALGTAIGILTQGRLMDRFGQSRILIFAVLLQSPALLAFVLALRAEGPPWQPALLAFTAGACEPQVGGALSTALAGQAVGLAGLGIGLFLGGLLLGSLMVACFSLVAAHIPPGTEVGGFTTLTAASLAANATATAIAGVLTETGGPAAPLLVAAIVALAATPLLLARRARRHVELQR